MAAELARALVGPDMATFESLVRYSVSPYNNDREHAQALFDLAEQTYPNSLALKLASVLHSPLPSLYRATTAELLRDVLPKLWPRLSPPVQGTLISLLLSLLRSEPGQSILHKLCDIVSEHAARILPDGTWPELLPSMINHVSSGGEAGFLVLAKLSESVGGLLLPFLEELHPVFLHTLGNSPNLDVRIAALEAVINFIQCPMLSTYRDSFQDLLPSMMGTLTEVLNKTFWPTSHMVLGLFIELARTQPTFFCCQLEHIVGSMLKIAENKSLERRTRRLGIEFVTTLSWDREKRVPEMMRELPQFIRRLLAIPMMMLSDIHDEPAWYSCKDEHYSFGEEYLCRLAISLGGETIVPVVFEQLPAFLAAPEWQKHHAALISLAPLAEKCPKLMIENLEQVVSMVLNSFSDPHPRVRWAAIDAIIQFTTFLGPDFQNQFHQRVLPALTASMDDSQNPRVQAHAVLAVRKLTEESDSD